MGCIYHQHSPTNELFDSFSSHMILPHIVQPTRIRNNSKTLIDNIYSNVITPNNISSNLTATISDHLPQFFIAPEIFSDPSSTKLNIFERYWWKFDQEHFSLDYLSVEWENLLKSVNNEGHSSILTKFRSILDMHAPLRKISNETLKFRNKSWITIGR